MNSDQGRAQCAHTCDPCTTLSARPTYALTTVSQPLVAMVRRGLDLLLARMQDPTLPDEVTLLRGTLTLRASTRTRASARGIWAEP